MKVHKLYRGYVNMPKSQGKNYIIIKSAVKIKHI
jgi:hypothetical protein